MTALRRSLFALTLIAGLLAFAAPSEAAAGITARIAPRAIDKGQVATVTGTISPAGAKSVVLQVRVGKTWADRQGGAVSASGTFSIAIRPKLEGLYTFRVRSSGGTVFSNAIYLRVYPPLLYAAAGKGVFYSPMFNVPGRWALTYTFDCRDYKVPNPPGIFATGPPFYDHTVAVGGSGPTLTGGDTVTVSHAGSIKLTIITSCKWTVKVRPADQIRTRPGR